jgi:hypothetical protein
MPLWSLFQLKQALGNGLLYSFPDEKNVNRFGYPRDPLAQSQAFVKKRQPGLHLGGQVATAGVEAPDAVLGQGMVWQQGHNRLKGGVTGRTAIADGVVPDISSRDASYYG